jgi:hypothetical protein
LERLLQPDVFRVKELAVPVRRSRSGGIRLLKFLAFHGKTGCPGLRKS